MTKQMVSAKVMEFDRWNIDGSSLTDVIKDLQELSQKYGESSRFDISCEESYGDTTVDVSIIYQREETDEEYSTRTNQLERLKEQEKARKLKLLEELKKEFGE